LQDRKREEGKKGRREGSEEGNRDGGKEGSKERRKRGLIKSAGRNVGEMAASMSPRQPKLIETAPPNFPIRIAYVHFILVIHLLD